MSISGAVQADDWTLVQYDKGAKGGSSASEARSLSPPWLAQPLGISVSTIWSMLKLADF